MKIHLENNFYIITDSKSWLLKKKRISKNKKTGELSETYERITSHDSPSSLLDYFLEMKLRLIEGELTFEELMKCFKNHDKERQEWLKKIENLLRGENDG